MTKRLFFLLIPLIFLPLRAGNWPRIPQEVWALSGDQEQVARGAVIVERYIDFQPFYIEQTLRLRVLSQAGVEALELPDIPAEVLYIEGQVVTRDGRNLPISKRDDFLIRNAISSADGTQREGVLIPPGVTSDCVLDLRWREATARGRANQLRKALLDLGNLPERCGDFWYWTLAGAFPTQTCVVRKGKDVFTSMILLGTQGFRVEQGAGAMGVTYTFRNLPALPASPYSSEVNRPSPKVVLYRPIDELRYLESKAPSTAYWAKAAEMFYRPWFTILVKKHNGYQAFSEELRKDLPEAPTERALVLGQRLARRMKYLDHLLFDEKPSFGARHEQDLAGASNLEFAARAGFADDATLIRMLFHLWVDAGLNPKIALVADKHHWTTNPEIRSPFQFSHILLGVEETGKSIRWIDPTGRMVPVGQVPPRYQGTRAVVLDSSTWSARIQDIPHAAPDVNTRTCRFTLEPEGEVLKVRVDGALEGAGALLARNHMEEMSPSQRRDWVKRGLEQRGLSLDSLNLANEFDPSKPLGWSATGSIPLELGRRIKLNPFPGMTTDFFLPTSLPDTRLDPILLPFKQRQEATCTFTPPSGYRLVAPTLFNRYNRWGEVRLTITQNVESGEIRADLQIVNSTSFDNPPGYKALKDYFEWVSTCLRPEIILEKIPEEGA